jgi:hypothetical protein
MKQKKSNQSKPVQLYKHSFGHYHTEMDAVHAKKELEKSNPKLKLSVVRETRRNNTWAKWCVCEFYPEKGSKKDQKKSNQG